MAKDLTAFAIDKAEPAISRRELPDGKVRGLFFIIQPTGKRSWAVRYRIDGSPRKFTIGSYPAIDLSSARRLASKALIVVAEGGDPAADKQVAKKVARAPANHEMVENVVARFIERHAKAKTREATWREAERILKNEIVERWKGKPLSVISRSDIHDLMDRIVDRGAPIAANRSLAVIRRMFSWAVEREIVLKSPCDGVKAPSPVRTRDRVLTDDELRLVWSAANKIGWPFGPLIQLLILTGQRRDEVGGMTWSEVNQDEKLWTLPRGRVKNDKGHTVPLSSMTMTLLDALPQIESKAGFVFTTTGSSAVSGFTNAKERIDKLIKEAAYNVALPGWTIHDLRRTLASGCARFGVAPQVVEAILNHKSGTIRGVAAIYNRYDHATEKRAALELWSRHIENITKPGTASREMAV